VSQEVVQSLQLSHQAYVLENGRVVLEGTGNELSQNEHIRKAYLGM
jgi:branched-chain amino acid transport system ATP-binding protein